ncbi:MAG TPA: C45 family peptidase [Acidisarcina sp.]
MRKSLACLAIYLGFTTLLPAGPAPQLHPASGLATDPAFDARIEHAYRRPPQNGWTYVHLEGTPSQIGYQHGYLLASEIADGEKVLALETTHDTGHDWAFFRNAAKTMLWPRIGEEYRQEMTGIASGLKAKGLKLDLWDVVAMNAAEEWTYYTAQYDQQHGVKPPATATAPEHCSAFVATGSWTADGKPVIAHNNWTGYLDGERWTMIFDIVPSKGHHFIMDGFPGLIHSADDFGINEAGIMITETTISKFYGWDSNGIAEFARARKAMQYSSSIDDFAAIMKKGNNGGYANDWLVADTRTGEIASLELGLKNVVLQRTRNGYFAGSNYPIDPNLAREETTISVTDMSLSSNARHLRWDQLINENKGKIDVAMAQKFLGDHYDTYLKKEAPSERTLCGHIDLSPRGSGDWQTPYGIAGAVQNKVADATMAQKMMFSAAAGHACGLDFKAAEHLKAHPEFSWQKDYLRDMDAYPWTTFQATRPGS